MAGWPSVCLAVCLVGCIDVWLAGCLSVWLAVFLAVCLSGSLSGWLAVWLAGWLAVWLAGPLVGCFAVWLSGWLAGLHHGAERWACPQPVCDTDVFLKRDVYPAGKHLEAEESPSESGRQGRRCSQGRLTK